ncbi:MAG TPA: L,D-transpeptidase [Ktedonobacterales bacterium]
MRNELPQGRRNDALWRLARAGIIALCAIVTLLALGVGGGVTAQRYSSAGQAAVVAPITYVSQQPPDAPLNAANQAQSSLTPTPVGKCDSCKSVKKSVPIQQAPPPPPAPAPTCSGSRLPLPGSSATPPSSVAIPSSGQYVLVSIGQQWLWAYNNGALYMQSPVTTGMPQLPTWRGTFHIFLKETNVWFYSYYPPGTIGYYTPEFIPYAMEYDTGGYYLHAAPWRQQFGPGTNAPHCDADGVWETGSHGCVNLPTAAAGKLYAWIQMGTTVRIV